MSSAVISLGGFSLPYSSLIITLAVMACFLLTWSLFCARGGSSLLLTSYLMVSCVLSLFLSRALHWYCHSEQYNGFPDAFTDVGTGGFVLTGVLFGIILTALLFSLFHCWEQLPFLLDSLSPGITLLFLFIRLTSLFNDSCRSKIAVNDPHFQHLPFAAPIVNASGRIEYRFAVFFAEAIVLAILFLVLVILLSRSVGKNRNGVVWLSFLTWYSAIEVLTDSTRYDSSFTRLNGFVSVVQTSCGVLILAVLILAAVRSGKSGRLKKSHWALFLLWLLALGGAGISEYLVQRHGNWYYSCYALMAICLTLMAGINSILLRTAYPPDGDRTNPSPCEED